MGQTRLGQFMVDTQAGNDSGRISQRGIKRGKRTILRCISRIEIIGSIPIILLKAKSHYGIHTLIHIWKHIATTQEDSKIAWKSYPRPATPNVDSC